MRTLKKTSLSSRTMARMVSRLRGDPAARQRASSGTFDRRQAAPGLLPAIPQSRAEPDAVPEVLISNLLKVGSWPGVVWSGQTTLTSKKDLPRGQHLPACTIRGHRLFAFENLSRAASAFSSIISQTGIERHEVLEWRKSPVCWRWFIELLNGTLQLYLHDQDIAYDRVHGRYYFRSSTRGSRRLRWGSGRLRTVVRAPPPETSGPWLHRAAHLRFQTLGIRLFLSVKPTWLITTDGIHPIPRRLSGELAMLLGGGKDGNAEIIRQVLAWSDVLCQGRESARIPAGDEFVTLARLPEVVPTNFGLADDKACIQDLLQFTHAEEDVVVSKDDLHGFIEEAASDHVERP